VAETRERWARITERAWNEIESRNGRRGHHQRSYHIFPISITERGMGASNQILADHAALLILLSPLVVVEIEYMHGYGGGGDS
jgi:hypothetical protein